MRKEILSEGVELYLGDCREILPTLGNVDAVVTDPPYGINYESYQPGAIKRAKIVGDNTAFDPAPLILISDNCVIWGANNFTASLPIGGWIVWDKRVTEAADKMMGAPFELAWCSRRTLFKIARIQHGGAKNADAINGDVANEPRYHPTQKPIRLMHRCIEFFPSAETILDPFMGSGSTGVAAVKLGRKFTGIEIEPKYFDIACRRIQAALDAPDMFVDSPAPAKQEVLEL